MPLIQHITLIHDLYNIGYSLTSIVIVNLIYFGILKLITVILSILFI